MIRSNGFTLIEIMVVLAIIAILATLALPNKSSSVIRTQVLESISLIESYKPMVEFVYNNTGRFPETNQAAGIPEPDLIKGNYVTSVSLVNGSFDIEFGAKIRSDLNGKRISIRPIYIEDSIASPISWICGNDSIPEGMSAAGLNQTDFKPEYLPIRCR